jgi:hypothetical protein
MFSSASYSSSDSKSSSDSDYDSGSASSVSDSYSLDPDPDLNLDIDMDMDLNMDLDLDLVDGIDFNTNIASTSALILGVERELEASIFKVEPVTHITYQLLFVDEDRAIERVERHVMRLTNANVIDRFDIGRIIKNARQGANATVVYRLTALIVYNIDLTLNELLRSAPFPASRFITALLSISNVTLRPTLACFHSANSLHIILMRSTNPTPTPTPTSNALGQVRKISIRPAASTRRNRSKL